jgi:K+-transporting ATPase ATPase A chain
LGGFGANTTWYDVALAVAMIPGRFVPIIVVLALAGTSATPGRV